MQLDLTGLVQPDECMKLSIDCAVNLTQCLLVEFGAD